jgi:PAS domain S-box-containing protein
MLRQRTPVFILGAIGTGIGLAAVVLGDSLVARLTGVALLIVASCLCAEYLARRSACRQLVREHTDTTALQGRLDAAAATSDGWLYVLDLNNLFIYSSAASIDCIGYSPAELLGRDASGLLSPDELPLIDTRLSGLPGSVSTFVVRARHRSGADRWLEVTIAAVVDAASQQKIGWSGTARHLTETKHPGILREIHRRGIAEILATEELAIAFQPIVDIPSGIVIGVEALSRFPSRQEVGPDVVFAEAAHAGLGAELELLAVRRALEEAAVLDSSLYIAVNVSPAILANPALLDTLLASPIDVGRVVVEITEHVSVGDYTILQRPRQQLRDVGVRLAVDDAGSGYASLRHILTLAPDIIKLDRALVTDLDSDRARRALVAAVVSFAAEIGATRLIGEGVETQAELAALTALGVDAAQGYHVGKPTTSPLDWSRWGTPLATARR